MLRRSRIWLPFRRKFRGGGTRTCPVDLRFGPANEFYNLGLILVPAGYLIFHNHTEEFLDLVIIKINYSTLQNPTAPLSLSKRSRKYLLEKNMCAEEFQEIALTM